MDLVLALLHLLRDLAQLGMTTVVDPGRIGEEVSDAVKRLGLAYRDLQGGDTGPEGVLQLGEDPFEARVLPVQLVHKYQARQPADRSLTPQVHRGVVKTTRGVHYEDGQVGDRHGTHRLAGEVERSGRIQEVDLVVMPFQGGQRSGQ